MKAIHLGAPGGIRLGPQPNTLSTGGRPPFGYTWTTDNGRRVYFNGRPVFDDGRNFYYR